MAVESKEVRAFKETLMHAEQGQAREQYTLGLMYANGVGVAQNFQQALHWYMKAAENGYAPAQYILGNKYATGAIVKQDFLKSFSWYLKAAEQGYPKALLRLGQFYASPHAEISRACIVKAAEKGLADAQLLQGSECAAEKGDYFQALYWVKKAAEQGLAAAQYAYGNMIANGQGCAPDLKQAMHWYRKAAGQKFAAAQLALCKIDELGGARDRLRRKAVPTERRQTESKWAEAAELGDAQAKYNLGQMYQLGQGVETDPIKAELWYLKAAEQNDALAQFQLGQICEKPRPREALLWYEKAAEQGNSDAQFALGSLYSTGAGVERDAGQGFLWYLKKQLLN